MCSPTFLIFSLIYAIMILGSIGVAAVATFNIKRPMLDYVRRDAARSAAAGGPRLAVWQRTVIRLI